MLLRKSVKELKVILAFILAAKSSREPILQISISLTLMRSFPKFSVFQGITLIIPHLKIPSIYSQNIFRHWKEKQRIIE